MRLGLYVNLFASPHEPAGLRDIVEQARLAEEVGFSWIVVGERHLHPPGYHEALTSLTWLAAHTSRIGLASAGIIAPFYHPVYLAETLANLDVLSGGRLTAGFVLGYRPEEFAMFGVEQRDRVTRFEECLTLLTRLWTEDQVSFYGRHTRVDGVFLSPRPIQQPRPRLWNGGRVPAVLARTARLCDGWTTSFNETPADLKQKIAEYRANPRGANSLGQDVIVCREGFCAPTSQAARATIERPLRGLYDHYTSWKRTSPDADRYTEPWSDVAARSVFGSPAECEETIASYSAMGVDGMVLRIQPQGVSQRDALRCIERFGELGGSG